MIRDIMDIHVGLLQQSLALLQFFDKKASGSGIKTENISKKELDEELPKPIIRKFMKRNHTHLL